jgi:predicted esterase
VPRRKRKKNNSAHKPNPPQPDFLPSKQTTFDDLSTAHDEAGILRSRNQFNDLISQEISSTSIPSHRIVLGGFSQGGALALFTGLTTPHRLAGIFALSAYLLLGDRVQRLASEGGGHVNKTAPWFLGHGDADPLVKYEWGCKTAEKLRGELGVQDLEFKTYHGLAHSADLLEIQHVEAFLEKCLPPLDDGDEGSKKADL